MSISEKLKDAEDFLENKYYDAKDFLENKYYDVEDGLDNTGDQLKEARQKTKKGFQNLRDNLAAYNLSKTDDRRKPEGESSGCFEGIKNKGKRAINSARDKSLNIATVTAIGAGIAATTYFMRDDLKSGWKNYVAEPWKTYVEESCQDFFSSWEGLPDIINGGSATDKTGAADNQGTGNQGTGDKIVINYKLPVRTERTRELKIKKGSNLWSSVEKNYSNLSSDSAVAEKVNDLVSKNKSKLPHLVRDYLSVKNGKTILKKDGIKGDKTHPGDKLHDRITETRTIDVKAIYHKEKDSIIYKSEGHESRSLWDLADKVVNKGKVKAISKPKVKSVDSFQKDGSTGSKSQTSNLEEKIKENGETGEKLGPTEYALLGQNPNSVGYNAERVPITGSFQRQGSGLEGYDAQEIASVYNSNFTNGSTALKKVAEKYDVDFNKARNFVDMAREYEVVDDEGKSLNNSVNYSKELLGRLSNEELADTLRSYMNESNRSAMDQIRAAIGVNLNSTASLYKLVDKAGSNFGLGKVRKSNLNDIEKKKVEDQLRAYNTDNTGGEYKVAS